MDISVETTLYVDVYVYVYVCVKVVGCSVAQVGCCSLAGCGGLNNVIHRVVKGVWS